MDVNFANIHEWLNLIIRWSHMLAGIMWIGTSLYFVWMDSSFEPVKKLEKGDDKKAKIDGELWMVHGGNFYHVEKRRFGPGEMPLNLHWFKWEATLTWLTGILLLIVVYYLTGGVYLIDSAKNPLALSNAQSVGLGLAVVFGGWFVYDFLFRTKWSKSPWLNIPALGLLLGLMYLLSQVMSGRGFFMHIGAMFGTMMLLNVWVHILPNQQAIIDASNKGLEPNYELGKKAKTRSMHNSYMTLPVLFVMISNHFGGLYNHPMNWLVLALIVLFGALVRHGMIILKAWPALPASLCLALLFGMTAQTGLKSETSGGQVAFAQVNHIIHLRCVQCHSQYPTDDVFKVAPAGVMFDQPEQIEKYADRILERAVVQQTMPVANKTQITSSEREMLKAWVRQGGRIH